MNKIAIHTKQGSYLIFEKVIAITILNDGILFIMYRDNENRSISYKLPVIDISSMRVI